MTSVPEQAIGNKQEYVRLRSWYASKTYVVVYEDVPRSYVDVLNFTYIQTNLLCNFIYGVSFFMQARLWNGKTLNENRFLLFCHNNVLDLNIVASLLGKSCNSKCQFTQTLCGKISNKTLCPTCSTSQIVVKSIFTCVWFKVRTKLKIKSSIIILSVHEKHTVVS